MSIDKLASDDDSEDYEELQTDNTEPEQSADEGEKFAARPKNVSKDKETK